MIKKTSFLLPFVLFGSTAHAAMILVNFGASTDTTGLGYNPIASFTNTPTALKYSGGGASGYELTYQNLGGNNTGGNNTIGTTDAINTAWMAQTGHNVPDQLRSSKLNFGKDGATCVITGLQAGKEYTFFSMAGRQGNGGGSITIAFDGVASYDSFTYINNSTESNPTLSQNNGIWKTGNLSQSSGVPDYAELTFVADDSGTFSFTYTGAALGFNILGFGLKENFIPEPATASLGLLALAAFGFRRKRR